MPKAPAARSQPLFVIIARERPVAVLLRRGPSDWFHVIRWDMARDRFERGAWLRGRIYEDRCDLSPDGELFLAFVLQGRKGASSSTTHAWSAVSRPPWLHALALWPQGTTYGGGGRFTGPRTVVLRNASPRAAAEHPDDGLEVLSGSPPAHASTGEVDGAEWSGRDHHGQLVFTRGYLLFRRVGGKDVALADFGGLRPEPLPAPDAARVPLTTRNAHAGKRVRRRSEQAVRTARKTR